MATGHGPLARDEGHRDRRGGAPHDRRRRAGGARLPAGQPRRRPSRARSRCRRSRSACRPRRPPRLRHPTPEPVFARGVRALPRDGIRNPLARDRRSLRRRPSRSIERSNDGGQTWTDVTPRYLGIAQVASLDGIAVDAAEAVSAVGAGCGTQALRIVHERRVLGELPRRARGLALRRSSADPSVVHMAAGPVEAPCARRARPARAARHGDAGLRRHRVRLA